MPELFQRRGTTPLSSIVDQLTELYTFVDDFLVAHPNLLCWRQSPHDTPHFADSEVLTLALLQGCLGVASLKQTYRLVAPIIVPPFRACALTRSGWLACTP